MVNQLKSKEAVIQIEGMFCASCVKAVEDVLVELDGVDEATVNLATGEAHVYGDLPERSILEDAIRDAGYDVAKNGQPDDEQIAELEIQGMFCASCVNSVEKSLKTVDGTRDVNVNLATETALVRFSGDVRVDPQALIKAVEDAGFEATYKSASKPDARPEVTKGMTEEFRRRFFIALPLGLIVMIMDMGPMLYQPWMDWVHPNMFGWNLTQFFLTSIILFYAGRTFFTRAWKTAKRKSADMNTLIAIGTGAAWAFSSYATFFGTEGGIVTPMDVYFDTAAVIIALLLLGKWMEERAKNHTRDALTGLLELTPPEAHLEKNGRIQTVSLDQIKPGDVLLVKAFEQIPVDGVLAGEEYASVDESAMTGESIPVDKSADDPVKAGTRNTNRSFRMIAKKVGADTALSGIIETVKKAQGSKPPIQRLADKIASVFVPVVLVIALITAFSWMFLDTPQVALVNMVAVLVIACPCALGLATPTGIMVGSGRAAEKGILIKDAVTLEKARNISVVLFDKTGTLTEGRMFVQNTFSAGNAERENWIKFAAAVESESDHPLAAAIINHASEKFGDDLPEAKNVETIQGVGIQGTVAGSNVIVRSHKSEDPSNEKALRFIQEQEEKGCTVIAVNIDGKTAGYISVADKIRDEAAETVSMLKASGVRVVMITGDQRRTAKAVAKKLGIDEFEAEVDPETKHQLVKKYRESEGQVAMVGDGINDAAALVEADLGIAISGGTDLAVSSSDITIMKNDLRNVVETIRFSDKTYKVIRQNLFWAFVYNTVGIPLAAFGFLSPIFAGAAMAMSSVSVVTNSLRIKRF